MAAAEAPAAAGFGASAALAALGLATALSCLFLLLLQAVYRLTIGLSLEGLASTFDSVPLPTGFFHIGNPLHWVARQIRLANIAIEGWIGWGIAQTERGTTMLFHGSADVFHWTTHELYKLGGASYGALAWFKHVELPSVRHYAGHVAKQATITAHHDAVKTARAATAPIYPKLNALDRFWRHQLDVFARGLDSLSHRLTGELNKAIHALRTSAARTRAETARIRGITAKQARRLARAERLLTTAGLISLLLRGKGLKALQGVIRATDLRAAVLRALAGLGLGFLMLDAFKEFGRRIGKIPRDLLDELLTLFSVVTGTMSLIEFAEYMIVAKEEMVEITREFWEAD